MYFFLIIIALLIGLPGIILFILGLIQKKQIQWIIGSAMIFVSLLIFVFSIVMMVRNSANFFRKNLNNNHSYYSNKYDRYSDENNDRENIEESDKTKETFSDDKGISGFIKGVDNKLTLIHVKTDQQLADKGVTIDKIEDYTSQTLKRNGIPLKLNLTENFNGKITLTAYSADNTEISACTIIYSATKGDDQSLEFDFDKIVNFSDIKYCILTESIQ